MFYPTLVMGTIAIILFIIAYKKGTGVHIAGIKLGIEMFLSVFILLIASFTVAGLVQVLVPKELISKWLGESAGLKGIMIGCFAGAITPGGPYTSFPIVAALYKSGAGIGVMVGYVTAWSLWAVARLPFEISLIGPKFTLIRVLSTLIFPPIAGIVAQAFFSKFA